MIERKYETQYFEDDPADETWILIDGELQMITGGDEDDDTEERK